MYMYAGARRVLTGAWTTNKWLSVVNETSFLPPEAINCLLMAPRAHTIEYDGANLVEVTIATMALWELQKRHIQKTKFLQHSLYIIPVLKVAGQRGPRALPKRWTLFFFFFKDELLSLSLVAHQNWMIRHYCWRHYRLWLKNIEKSSWN